MDISQNNNINEYATKLQILTNFDIGTILLNKYSGHINYDDKPMNIQDIRDAIKQRDGNEIFWGYICDSIEQRRNELLIEYDYHIDKKWMIIHSYIEKKIKSIIKYKNNLIFYPLRGQNIKKKFIVNFKDFYIDCPNQDLFWEKTNQNLFSEETNQKFPNKTFFSLLDDYKENNPNIIHHIPFSENLNIHDNFIIDHNNINYNKLDNIILDIYENDTTQQTHNNIDNNEFNYYNIIQNKDYKIPIMNNEFYKNIKNFDYLLNDTCENTYYTDVLYKSIN